MRLDEKEELGSRKTGEEETFKISHRETGS